MIKKVALHFFGQLRYVEAQHSIYPLLKFFRDREFEVDTYGTFWDDEYTQKQIREDIFKDYKSVKLITEPKVADGDLQKYFYSLENTINQRKGEYEFIIFSRYDINFKINEVSSFSKFYNKLINQSDKPSIFFIPGTRLETKNGRKKIDDKLFICNSSGADKICRTYSKFKNKDIDILDLRYHSSLLSSVEFFKLELFENIKFFTYTLIRHDYTIGINLDNTLEYENVLLRDYIKRFQDYNEMKKFIDEVCN